MVGQRDNFSGNILFYDYLLAKRNPVFLNRNLVRALEIDQYTLQHGNTEGLPGNDHQSRLKWKPPTLANLGNTMKKQETQASFYLEPISLKPINKHNTTDQKPQSESRSKVRALFSIRCAINVAIHYANSEVPCAQRPDPEAVISGSERDGEKTLVVNTLPMDPITFGEMLRNRAPTDSKSAFKMRLSISFTSIADAEEFFKRLGPEYAKRAISKKVWAVWDDVTKVPIGKTVLPLTDQQGPLPLGFEVKMYRICAADTPALVGFNRGLRSKALTSKYPTPQPETQYELTFVYGDKSVIYKKIVCPHCLDRRKQADIDALRLHLDAWHDHLSYRMVHHETDAAGVEHWKFECEVESYKTDSRASDRAEEPFDVLVIPPRVPFNRRTYLDEGNDDYQKAARLEKSIKAPTGRSIRANMTTVKPTVTRKSPSEIHERPVIQKKKYLVPRAPNGIKFFRLVSKRPLDEGEYISESDDDVNETWVEQRKAAEKTKLHMWSEDRRKFLVAFDSFMYEEGVNSDVHAEAAIIRFARSKKDWLTENAVWRDFKQKIDELREDDIISQEAHTVCVEMASEGDVPEPQNGRRKYSSLRRRSKSGRLLATSLPPDPDGDIEMADMDSSSSQATDRSIQPTPSPASPSTQTPTEPPFNQCLCGHDPLASSRKGPVVECANLDCIRQLFHVACLKKILPILALPKPQARDWTCLDCAESARSAK